jgi:hypothetical protein
VTSMSVHLFLAAAGFSDWIGPALVAVFFFVLPILRSIREAREKQEQAERRAREGLPPVATTRAPVETDMDEARRKWEALLRGEEVDVPAPTPVPLAAEPEAPRYPSGANAPAANRPADLTTPFDTSRNPETLTSLEPVLSDTGPATTFDEARLAQVEEEDRARGDKKRSDDLLFAEREGDAVRADVAQWIGSSPSKQPAPASVDLTRRRNVLGAGPGLSTRAGLRRAILASEVLGRPVGMRDGSDEAGPVGMRR